MVPWQTRPAADIGRGLRQATMVPVRGAAAFLVPQAARPCPAGTPYLVSTAFTSSPVSGGQSGSTSSLPMP